MILQTLKKTLTGIAALVLTIQGAAAYNLVLTNSFLGSGTDGSWDNGANFSGGNGNPPGAGDTVLLTNLQPVNLLAVDTGWTNFFDGQLVSPSSQVNNSTINALWCSQTNDYANWALNSANGSYFTLSQGAHNVYIADQLNVVSSTPMDLYHIYSNTVAVGTGYDITNSMVYLTLAGPGSLNVTNPVGCLWVGQGSQTAGSAGETHDAVLDLSGLNTFNCVLTNIFIAADNFLVNSGTNPSQTGYARPQGCLYFALTNNITLLATNFPALVLGYEPNNNGPSYAISNCLGQVNFLNFDQMLIGGPKTSASTAGLYFMPTNGGMPPLMDCTAKFRNIDGVSRQTAWIIGDDYLSPGTTTTAYGTVNFTRGGVDALVDTIYLGRGGVPSITTGTAVGALTFGSGTTNTSVIDVNQLEIGDMLNGTAPCQGQILVYSNGTLNVNNYIRLINVPAGVTSSLATRGFMFVYGGTVNVAGSILNNGSPGGGYSLLYVMYGGTLNLQPNPAKPPGNISVQTLQLGKGTIANFATLSVSNMNILPPNTTFALAAGQALSPGALNFSDVLTLGVTNTLPVSYTTNSGVITTNNFNLALQLDGSYVTNYGNGLTSLSLTNAALLMDIGTKSDKININGALNLTGVNQVYVNPVAGFGPGTYPILTYSTNSTWLDASGSTNYGLHGNLATQLVAGGPITNSVYNVAFDASTPGVVNMVVNATTATALTWTGDGAANVWDVIGANNWNNGTAASKFYQYDSVTFGDTGSATPAINLAAAVYPAAVTVNATQNYAFAGSGTITGPGSLTKSGTGTLTLLETNGYSLGTTINAGTVRLGDGVSNYGSLGSGPVNLSGTLAVAVPANQTQTLANQLFLTNGGVVSVEGPGKVLLAGNNTNYGGQFKVLGGTLAPTTLLAISSGFSAVNKWIYVTNSGTLDINGLALSNNITLSGAGVNGNGALVNNGASQANSTMQIYLAGNAAVGGNFRMDLNNISAPGGVTGNGYTLTKVGSNCVSLYNVATNAWTNGFSSVLVNGGVLRVQNGDALSGSPASTVTVASGATLELNNLWVKSPVVSTATLLDGSCLYGTGGTGKDTVGVFTNAQGNLYNGTINLNGTVTADTSVNSVLVINGPITGTGDLVKGIGYHPTSATTATSTGLGSLTLGGNNTFTGNLVVQTGTVFLTNNVSVATAANLTLAGGTLNAATRVDGTLTVGANQNLGGSGTVIGTLVVPAGATITPGNPTGLLTNLGSTTLAGTANVTIGKTNGVLSAGALGVSGTLTLGGTLNATFTGTGLAVGDTFALFTSPGLAGHFSKVNLPAGATWTDRTAIDGTIVVASLVTEPATPPTLAATFANGSLTLSWPGTYTTYVLQAQTNSLKQGLGTNWVTVGTVNNTITLPVNPANPSVFYRLSH